MTTKKLACHSWSRRLALALDKDADFFKARTDDATAQMVLFKYPPRTGDLVSGIAFHPITKSELVRLSGLTMWMLRVR
jgi:hypothetical protein